MDSGSNFAEFAGSLENEDVVTRETEGDCSSETSESGTDNDDLEKFFIRKCVRFDRKKKDITFKVESALRCFGVVAAILLDICRQNYSIRMRISPRVRIYTLSIHRCSFFTPSHVRSKSGGESRLHEVENGIVINGRQTNSSVYNMTSDQAISSNPSSIEATASRTGWRGEVLKTQSIHS